jgi:OOP family OmpA-OmpF porin
MNKWLILILTIVSFCKYSRAQELEPTDSDALLKVSVINGGGKALGGEKVSFVSEKTKKVYGGTTDTSGKFELLIPKGCIYDVHYKQFTSDTSYRKYNIPATTDLLTASYTLRINLPKTYTLHNVNFDVGKASLTPASDKELNELAEFMHYQKTKTIEVAGYTDNVGNESDNQKLSEARANSVRNYLIKKGIAGDKIQAKGFGSADPVASNDVPDGRQQNRRTEVHILKQ